jgi:hypothetical protein
VVRAAARASGRRKAVEAGPKTQLSQAAPFAARRFCGVLSSAVKQAILCCLGCDLLVSSQIGAEGSYLRPLR